MIENWIYKTESNPETFWYENRAISLREYTKNLVLYWSGENEKCEYAIFDKTPKFEKEPSICSDGKFGSFSRISSPITFKKENFESISNNFHVSFWLSANNINGNYAVTLTKKDDFPEELDGDFSFGIQARDEIQKQVRFSLNNGNFDSLKQALLFEIDPSYKVEITDTTDNSITLKAVNKGEKVNLINGFDGTDVLSLFDINVSDTGVVPTEDITLLSLKGRKSEFNIKHLTTRHLQFNYSQSDVLKTTYIEWNNNGSDFDHIEVDIDSSVMYIFLNGNLEKAVLISPIKREAEKATLTLNGNDENVYSFEELIVKNVLVNKESFTSPTSQLTKYDTNRPFIDFHFSGKNIFNNSLNELVFTGSSNISLVLNYDGLFYYYNNGAWRASDGSFAQSSDPYTFADYISEFLFTGKDEIFIRAYFESDGDTDANIQELYFKVSDESVFGNSAQTAAILVGLPEFEDYIPEEEEEDDSSSDNNDSDNQDNEEESGDIDSTDDSEKDESDVDVDVDGEEESNDENDDVEDDEKVVPPKIDLAGKDLIITTDQGTTEMTFEEDMWVGQVIEFIKSQYPNGISTVYQDNAGHIVLVSETKGDQAFITVSGEAAPILFGLVLSAQGTDQIKNTIEQNYDEFIEKVKTYSSGDLIPIEINDDEIRLFLQEAINLYKKYRSDDISTYKIQLVGSPEEGYEIPPVIENHHDIVDILFRPLFPISFYNGFDNDADDVISMSLVNALAGKGPASNSYYGQGLPQDYYISLMSIDTMEMSLGLKPTWKVYNNRLFIFPNSITKYLTVTILYKSPIDPVEALRDPWIIQYVAGKIRCAQGEVRGQYGANLSTGGLQIQFNADTMYQRGKEMVEDAIREMQKNQEPLGFLFG